MKIAIIYNLLLFVTIKILNYYVMILNTCRVNFLYINIKDLLYKQKLMN